MSDDAFNNIQVQSQDKALFVSLLFITSTTMEQVMALRQPLDAITKDDIIHIIFQQPHLMRNGERKSRSLV